jgi:hypothetical protein
MWGTMETLGLIRGLTAILGGTLFVIGYRAYRATHRVSILLFAIGMGTASAGYILEGVLVQQTDRSLLDASLLESVITLAAFVLLAASLWVKDASPLTGSREPAHGTRPTGR